MTFPHLQFKIRFVRRFRLFVALALCLPPAFSWGRIRAPLGDEDIPGLAKDAPLVFRGQVTRLALTLNQPRSREGVAFVAVDRWYKGQQSQLDLSGVPIHFAYNSDGFFQGHNCSDLVLDSYWIFFAKPGEEGVLELFHDCEGALSVSSQLAPHATGDFLAQIEQDFRAGLADSDPAARLASIQRLAGLASPASREALRDVVAHGSEQESRWALFAAVKTGDATVMPQVVPILVALRHDKPGPYADPEGSMAVALRNIHDPEAVPSLIQILDQAPDGLVRNCAMLALAELKSERALDAYARSLSDPSESVRFNALLGMRYVTQSVACSSPKLEDAPAFEVQCKQWWDSTGRKQFLGR